MDVGEEDLRQGYYGAILIVIKILRSVRKVKFSHNSLHHQRYRKGDPKFGNIQ